MVSRLFNAFFFRLITFLLASAAAYAAAAAPLVLKDDYRSPRNPERRFRKSTRLIVLHTTEAHARSALNKLCERGEAHYCLSPDGTVYRIVDRDREAFHAGRSMWNGKEDCDEYSIGIEVVGYHDKAMPFCQLAALKELVDRLQKIYGLKDQQVVCHSHVAYGAPNTWHKKKHRGRKRCGMLFAMPSVRARLGLTLRPAYDPDVRAKRLVQADSYLDHVLYGSVDTMAAVYGRAVPPKARAKTPSPKAGAKAAPAKSGARPAPAKGPAKQPPAPPKAGAKAAPPPVVKPPLVVPKNGPQTAASQPPPVVVPEEEEESLIDTIGLTGKFFRKKAKYVRGTPPKPAVTNAAVARPLPLPPNLRIARPGDDVRDLQALVKLKGYVRGGPVSATLSPYKIVGAAWKDHSTYYYLNGKIVTGDQVDEKSIKPGTFIFYRKK